MATTWNGVPQRKLELGSRATKTGGLMKQPMIGMQMVCTETTQMAPSLHLPQTTKGFQTSGSVQFLAQVQLKEVPKDFIQPSEHRRSKDALCQSEEIPVVDMQGLDGDAKSSFLSKLGSACEEWGFFQVVNHGVKKEVLENMKKTVSDFFHLPLEVKQKWAMIHPPGHYGYGRFNTSDETVADWVDIFAQKLAPASLRDERLRPTEPPAYREVEAVYYEELKRFIRRLAAAISESLCLPPDYIETVCGEYTSDLRLNHYPPCPQPDRVLGVASHSDATVFTVLIEQGGSGLQVQRNGCWVPVNAIPDALIVNVGDLLQVMSNGRYRSVNHRAVVDGLHERFSIVTFYFPSDDVIISPAEPLLGESNPPRYRKLSFPEYLTYYFSNKARGKGRIESLLIQQ